VLFVDDTNILVLGDNVTNLQYKISNILNELQMWFELNNLVVNAEEVMAMSFHTLQSKRQCHRIYLKGERFDTKCKQDFWVYTLMKICNQSH